MRKSDSTLDLEFLFSSTYEYSKSLISSDLDWDEFTTCFNAWETKRRQHIHTDILPTLACIAAGGDINHVQPLSAYWTLTLFACRIFDDIQDGQTSGPWMDRGIASALPIAISASYATTVCLSSLDAETETKDTILSIMSKAFALAAKSQALEPYSIETYFRKIIMSTASTIAAALWCGGRIATQDKNILYALYNYGLNIGIAASIIADCKDLYPSDHKASDLAMKNITLPILFALSCNKTPDHRKFASFWDREDAPNETEVQQMVTLLEEMGAISRSYQVAQSYQNKAIALLEIFPNGLKEGLVDYAS